MGIVAHIHNAEDQHIGYICGPPIAGKKELHVIRHARGCQRHGKPFIRVILAEFSSHYLCFACYRAYEVTETWVDEVNGTRQVNLRPDWWGWRHAQALEVLQLKAAPLWAQENGKGLAHYQLSYGFRCGRVAMFCPMACNEPTQLCQRCVKGKA